MRLASIQVGLPFARADGWTTAYRKKRVTGPVRVRRENLEGDAQANRRFHGGPDMAILAYPEEHYEKWRAELAWPDLTRAAFGENFTVAGASEESACLGDVWRVGTALLQISEPRKPCRNISRFWCRPGLAQRVGRTGRQGFYLRVLEEGIAEAGQEIALVDRPHPLWSVSRAAAARRNAARARGEAADLLKVAALGKDWRLHLLRTLARR
jgi:MOSC domain-containing protein YiiM